MNCDKDCEKRCTRRVKPYPNTPDDLPIQMVEDDSSTEAWVLTFLALFTAFGAGVVAGLFFLKA